MATTLDNLENEVANLDPDGDPDAFFDAYQNIVRAVSSSVDVIRLIAIINSFRNRLPPSSMFSDIKTKAGALHFALTNQTLGNVITAISSRNTALNKLKSELNVQILNGHRDATVLRKTRNALGKVETTVNILKGMLDDMTDNSLKGTLLGFLTGIGNLAGTFAPDGPSND